MILLFFTSILKIHFYFFQKRISKIIDDKGYSSNKNYNLLDSNNIKHRRLNIIPPRRNMKLARTYKYDKNEYKERIRIEQIFARLKMFKRINSRYDKFLRSYSAYTYLAFSIIALNIMCKK